MTAWSRHSRYALAFTGAISLSLSAAASCHSVKCASDAAIATSPTVAVIIQYQNDPSDAEVSAINQIGPVYHRNHLVHTVGAVIPASQLDALANRAGVSYVSVDRVLSARQAPTTPIGTSPEFTAEPINAPYAWAKNFDGQGIGVAVIDSGITPSADFSVTATNTTPLGAPSTAVQTQITALASAIVPGGPAIKAAASTAPGQIKKAAAAATLPGIFTAQSRIVYSYNFTSDDPTDTLDAYGHGTHVAGLIAGNGSNSLGPAYNRTFKGIAPNANLINLRVLDANGQGNDSSVIAAINAAIALKNTYNIRVINLSLGRPIYESYTQDPLCQAVEKAWQAGIVVVVAAGNDGRDLALSGEGYGTINAPGNDPYALTIGASNPVNTAAVSDDVMASYSSKGPTFIDQIAKPDLIAPGNLVTSILSPGSNLQAENPTFYTPQNWYIASGSATPSTTYFPLSGTSMATAVTSGAVADLVEAASYLTPDQFKVLLMMSANKNVIPATNVVTDPSSGDAYTAHNDLLTQGAGYLDLEATINSIWNHAWEIPANASAMSPATSYDATTGNVTLVPDKSSVWLTNASAAATVLVGPGNIYGQTAFNLSGATCLWGRSALAGASDPNAFTALWGRGTTNASSTLWSSGSTDAATALWGRDTTSSASTPSGSTALWGRQTSAGSTALWGRQTTSSSSTNSGSTALWGRQTNSASNSVNSSSTNSQASADY